MIGLSHLKWIKKQKATQKIKVNEIKISNLVKWRYDKKKIFHSSNKFFRIIGVEIKTNFFKKNWDQPIIKQNEIGILGIIKDKIKNKYLLQAKLEPGNINKLQLSPTVQATKSNYSKVHGGKNIAFLDLYDSSANNAIIECLARATPILVNPLPAVVEYLGQDYPFYFNDLDEAAEKAKDFSLIKDTHEFMLNCEIREKLSGDYFRKEFEESEVYKLL